MFNPFEKKDAQTSFPPGHHESDSSHQVKSLDDAEVNRSKGTQGGSVDLASIFEFPTFFESSVALDDMLQNADPSVLVDLLDQSHDVPGIERRQATQEQIFRKFATIDPVKALSHAQSFPKIQYAHFAALIYRDWSLIDLDAALSYAEQHIPTVRWWQSEENAILEHLFRAASDLSDNTKLDVATRLQVDPYVSKYLLQKIERDKPLDNPDEAWKEVLSVENFGDDEKDQLFQIALVVIEKDGYAKFAELVNSIQDRSIRNRLISRTLTDRMRTDEIGVVFEHAVHLFHETARSVLFQYARNWALNDPHAALDAVSKVPSDQLRKHLEEHVIDSWISTRPLDVVQQLESLPVEYREVAFERGIWSMSAQHPKETTEYLDEISDPGTKWNLMWNLLQNWAVQDIEEAFTWFLDNPDLEIPLGNSRATFLSSLKSRVTPEIAPSLVEVALEYPVDETGSGWEGSIIEGLAFIDRKKAKELLPQIREGPGRLNTYVAIGLLYFRQDRHLNSAIELTEDLPEADHAEFFGELLARFSPQQALKHIDDLPTPEAQAKAALKLLQKAAESSNSPYTDKQIDHLESFLTAKERAVLEQASSSPQQ